MPRTILDITGLCERFKDAHLTANQIYKWTRKEDPLPYRKIGKKLFFDEEKFLKWWDKQPGKDGGL